MGGAGVGLSRCFTSDRLGYRDGRRYQTAGETCRRGTNIYPDTGGGWMNGRGDDTMTMFLGYGHMVDFFTSFEWWKTDPHDELVNSGVYCLAMPGEIYAMYLPKGGKATVRLECGSYQCDFVSALSGEKVCFRSRKGLPGPLRKFRTGTIGLCSSNENGEFPLYAAHATVPGVARFFASAFSNSVPTVCHPGDSRIRSPH